MAQGFSGHLGGRCALPMVGQGPCRRSGQVLAGKAVMRAIYRAVVQLSAAAQQKFRGIGFTVLKAKLS
jgi:hypothetical protein